MVLTPAVIVHDALIAYAKAKDIELLYDHYQESFYKYLDVNYGFRFPFDLEIAINYYDKATLGKDKAGRPRHFTLSGTNTAIVQIIERVESQGKKVAYIDEGIDLYVIKSRIDKGYDPITQYVKNKGEGSFDKDYSSGSYTIKFID